MFYKFFPHLPFYAKWGAIPESYLVALSYEEQLLWLCKMITDLDTKIDESFNTLKKYIDDNLQNISETLDYLESSKQDKLIPGENIMIDGNVISAIYDENLSNLIISGSTVPFQIPREEILPMPPYPEANSAYAIIQDVNPGEIYKIKGRYSLYLVRASDNYILARQDDVGTDYYLNFRLPTVLPSECNIVVGWHNTDEHTPSLLKTLDFSRLFDIIDRLNEEIVSLQNNKQDKLIPSEKVQYYTYGNKNYISIVNGEAEAQYKAFSNLIYDTSFNVGDTLPTTPQTSSDEYKTYVFKNIVAGEQFNLAMPGYGYLVNPRNNEILQKIVADINSVTYNGFTMEFEGTLYVIGNHNTKMTRAYNFHFLNTDLLALEKVVGKNYARSIEYQAGQVFADYNVGDEMLGQTIPWNNSSGLTAIPHLNAGDKIKIKGDYKGYLIDSNSLIVREITRDIVTDLSIIEIDTDNTGFWVSFYDTFINVPMLYVEKAPEESLNLTAKNNIYLEEGSNTTYISAINGENLESRISTRVYYPTSLDIGDPCEGISATANQASVWFEAPHHNECEIYLKGTGTIFVCYAVEDLILAKIPFNYTNLEKHIITSATPFNKIFIDFDDTNLNSPMIISSKFNNYYNLDETNSLFMEKRYEGENIFFDNNGIHETISAYMQNNLSSSINYGYYIDRETGIGETLDLTPIQDPNDTSSYIIIDVPSYGANYLVYNENNYLAYIIDEDNVVIDRLTGRGSNIYCSGEYRLILVWDLSEISECKVLQLLDTNYFTDLENRVQTIESQIGTINTTLTNINTGTGV